MLISKSRDEEILTIKINADLIGHRTRAFSEFCKKIDSEKITELIIDLQPVNSIDSLGMIEISKLIEKGINIRLINLNHNVSLFFNCHAPYVLNYSCQNKNEAIASIK